MNIVEILVPDLPESVTDATVAKWHKQPGDLIERDEVIVEIETDKVILEVPASANGILEVILQTEGTIVTSRQILGQLKEIDSHKQCNEKKIPDNELIFKDSIFQESSNNNLLKQKMNDTLSPGVRRFIAENELEVSCIEGTGLDGRITREDVEKRLIDSSKNLNKNISIPIIPDKQSTNYDREKRVPMTRLRKRVAERLLEAKNNTVMLTTFNEVNMQPIIDLRKQYGENFEKRYAVRLGFMSFYIKAVLEALRRFPEVNASIDGDDIVYHDYFDINIAVSTPRGLVTPLLKNIDALSMAEVEKKIKELAIKGRNGKLTVEELTGGNFTITNGGVFGSLMSTPIINPPQSAILGMHAIKDRPIARNGEVVVLPMMYLALSYDHRLIDGREAVGYLVTVKEMLEDPVRLLLDI
ncbi:2-oxoglutarate dehydrogenase complex dihydrolipoyllysine-residue succinyltransferase [Candidatus Pantoea carbekii]|uniref:Dihydrolipoyllysine-residue succinyltransferase component of 2-oxoglutarate dehydrogenase complex n=1 Tax=Candidatus Pantoea carbekii TaxID=1235990 RepID=U3U3H8_9GAMM|nr:2-oxoglutarate dehydrogenase complex dihydrolipoyllysine-residue succinyltransferase [Candidatus Pantoea carbekii]AKC32190.1 dihydrolipoyllysine-residue succinyltransferase component of 2oxoglutarate dehydrogenase complex SucB [Candidatus Pantoea carbekii]BAO00721.1 dihydrolipoamide succinyltransferase [Candidatus Pantoea carbekii]